MLAIKRITNEFKEIKLLIDNEPVDFHRFLSINTIDDDIFKIEVSFLGPKETPYEEIINYVKIKIPERYPHQAPTIGFTNTVYHPNIDMNEGTICLDILKDKWTPVYTLRTILTSIISLLSDPNPDSPLNSTAADEYRKSLKSEEGKIAYTNKILEKSLT
jgi:ubiquitin-protein ligase